MSKTIALDSSVRKYDDNGHLRVERTVITKAAINEYYGHEIPNWEALGLSEHKIYKLLRCPDEIQRGMDTFAGKQLLLKHTAVDSKNTQPTLTIGSIGSRLTFEDGKLYADLTFWDDEAIGLVESERMRELSAGYGYVPVMTAGIWNGERYDGIMTQIKGNHVALVERGRIGADAVIGDSQTIKPVKGSTMKLSKSARQRIHTKLTATVGKLALDGLEPDSVDEIIDEVIKHTRSDGEQDTEYDAIREIIGDDDKFNEVVKMLGGKADDSEHAEDSDDMSHDEDDGEKAERERRELEEADKDDRDAMKDEKRKKLEAMREELRKLESELGEDSTREMGKDKSYAMDADTIARSVEAKFIARDEVESIVGKIAMDSFKSADDVYRYALDHQGVEHDGVSGKGLRSMVKLAVQNREPKTIAKDSAFSAKSKHTQRFIAR